MMRLALAAAFIGAALLPAVTAAPTCTEDTCCVAKVMGMCKDNTHDASGEAQGEAGYDAAEVDDIDCSGEATNTQNKGSEATGRTTALCCEAPAPAPTPAPTYGCGDKIGDRYRVGRTHADTPALDVDVDISRRTCQWRHHAEYWRNRAAMPGFAAMGAEVLHVAACTP